ncbi:MAG: RsmB/NOP family class I SAM-dependent RNA methyltransferase [Pontimonas sp.]
MAEENAREVAWRLLRAVWRDQAYANLIWPKILRDSSLDEADKRFSTELAYGTLRHTGTLVAILRQASGKNPDSWQPEVSWVMQLGCYQLLYMRTATHAAVNETVNLARRVGVPRATGLVNAVLRKVAARSKDDWLVSLCASATDESDCLSMAYAHPRWVVQALEESLARENRASEIEALLASHNTAARVTAALLPGCATPDTEEERTPYSPIGVYLSGDPAEDPRVRTAQARIQDEGSQLAALVAAQGIPMRPGEHILDACSGPGGKTAVLAAFAASVGARVTAYEIAPHRAELVRGAIAGLSDPSVCEVTVADATEITGSFDRILLDAPCSGLGALRRRPEARWVKQESDLTELHELQSRLLDACLGALRHGGVLTYVTCSPVVSETSGAIANALSRHHDVVAVDTAPLLEGLVSAPIPSVAVGTAVQLWPHRHGTDAMFIQVLQKHPSTTN